MTVDEPKKAGNQNNPKPWVTNNISESSGQGFGSHEDDNSDNEMSIISA